MDIDLSNTITFIKKYILKEYNWFIIDINDSFIGCKFHNDKYYIFFVSIFEDELTFTYRTDFTSKDVIRVKLPAGDNELLLSNLIDKTISLAIEKNETLEDKRKLLKNSLVNYNYKKDTKSNDKEEKNKKDIFENKDIELIDIFSSNNEEKIDDNNTELEYGLDTPLEDLEMSARLKNGLQRSGYKTVRDFLSLNHEQIGKIRHLGKKTIEEAEQLAVKLSTKYKLNNVALAEKKEISISDDLIDKIYSEIPIDECGLSVRLVNGLKRNNIMYLSDLIKCPKEILEKIDNLGRKSVNEAIRYKKKIYNENAFGEDNSDFLLRVIKAISEDDTISIIMLKNYLNNNCDYPVDNLVNDINNMRNKNLIEYTMDGIKIKKKTLEQALNEMNLSTKLLLVERLNGKTLQELGKTRNITRERARQKLVKAFNSIPSVEEDKYKQVFEDYNFSEEDFSKIFETDKIVYNYLNIKYKSGELDIEEALKDEIFNEKQKEIIRGLRKIAKVFGDTVIINKQNIAASLAKEYAKKSISLEDFTNMYNDYVNENSHLELSSTDDRSMEGLLSRSGVALFGLGRRFRYYDFNNIASQDYETLKDLFSNMDAGYYSTLVIYKNNSDLMNSLDIRDEYELHNMCKTLFSDLSQISFDRMPNFSINGISKNEFISEKIKELSPISVSDFIEIMESEYGHKSNSMATHITRYFKRHIDNGIIKSNITILPDYQIEKIKYLLKKPIYNIDDLKELLKANGFEDTDIIITSANMYRIGYRIRSSYICKKDIESIEEYIKQMANENDFIANYNFLQNNTFKTMIKRVERSLDIFLISNEEYITIKKLNELGITKEDISAFCEEVVDKFKDAEYFTLSNVRNLIDIYKLDDYGFDDIFLESIISNIENISYVKFSNNKIFSFINQSFNSKKFIVDNIGSRISIFIDKLQNEIEDKYDIEVSQEKIKNAIIDTDMYYSDELTKIYQNKEYYYEEVFSYE